MWHFFYKTEGQTKRTEGGSLLPGLFDISSGINIIKLREWQVFGDNMKKVKGTIKQCHYELVQMWQDPHGFHQTLNMEKTSQNMGGWCPEESHRTQGGALF